MGTSFVVAVFLQTVRGYNAIETGLVFTAATAGILASSLAAERLVKRYPQRTLILAGFVVTAAGIGLLVGLVGASSRVVAFVPGLLLIGLGLGVMLTPSVNIVESNFHEELQGEISGVSRAVSNLGSSFGAAIAGTILVSDLASGNGPYVIAMVVLGALALLGLAAAFFLPADREHRGPPGKVIAQDGLDTATQPSGLVEAFQERSRSSLGDDLVGGCPILSRGRPPRAPVMRQKTLSIHLEHPSKRSTVAV